MVLNKICGPKLRKKVGGISGTWKIGFVTTVNRNSLNICCFRITACPSSYCGSITAEATTNYITESSSALNLVTLATTSPLYTTTHVNVAKSTTDRKCAAFHYTTFYSGSSLSLNLPGTSVTQRYSLRHSQSDSAKLSTITVASSYQTPTLESISSLKLSSSSLSLVSSSSPLLLSIPSPSSSLLQASSHGFLSFLTPSPTRYVKSSSMAPSPSTVRPTDGIEIEIKPHHSVSDIFIIIIVELRILVFIPLYLIFAFNTYVI